MLPVPTRSARLCFVACALLLGLALIARSSALVVLAGGGLWGLALCLATTLPLGNRLRRQRLEFAWWHGHDDGRHGPGPSVTAGSPFTARCYLRNHAAAAVVLRRLSPALPEGARCLAGEGSTVEIPGRSRVEFSLTLSSPAAGRLVAQGLSVMVPGPLGLFETPLYFPALLSVKVLPRAAGTAPLRQLTGGGLPTDGQRRRPLHERGAGIELRELRELQPGDPFNAIAWKPSARRGKLLVREVEHTVQQTLSLLLEVAGTMRGGPAGTRKLDVALEVSALLARGAIEHGDRVGLVAVDGRVVTAVPVGEGRPHLLRIYDALLRTTEVVDADLTAATDDEVAARVARYMRQQDGLRLPAGPPLPEDLAFHARRTLRPTAEREPVVAGGASHATLRRYCRERGIALPYRPETVPELRVTGLCRALRQAGGATRVPRTIVVMTDFDGIEDLRQLERMLRLLRAHGHRLAFVWPDPRPSRAGDGTADPLTRDLRRIFGLQEERRLQAAQRLLSPLGIPLLRAHTDEPVAVWLGRMQRAGWAA